MKTKKQQQNKLLKIKLIKTKTYSSNYLFKKLKIQDFECKLKKALLLIYKYNVNNKKITFICNNCNTNALKNTNNFLINNKFSFNNDILFLKKSDLIVIYFNKKISLNSIKKIYELKIPFIFFSKSCYTSTNFEYRIPSNFLFLKNKKFDTFISIIRKILEKF